MTPGEWRETIDPIRTQLDRIATTLETLALLLAPEPEPLSTPCLHPEEQRRDFGMTHGKPDWLCEACGYRTETTT